MSGAGPDPRRGERADALLGAIRRESSGRLKVFLGAAPGVGKTYAMLGLAQVLKRQGVDVVVGTAQTHGRAETQALLEGLEVLPPRQVPYKGHVLEELDLDALLARRPAVALVDELAHRNAPGSRHPHRYQDIDELLDAGIDVHTTVNIQHLESLNDIVYRITGVRVTETVPDSVFDRLRDIVLIDLPPRELIERLEQGKVYVPEQAARALQAFFSPTNLTALRELAMQTAANRVDSDLRESQAVRGLPGLPLRRRVLVAIDGQGQSEYLVRIGRRLAERRDAPWTVVTVQRSGAPLPVQQLEVDRAMALARRLGGDAEILHGGDVVETLLDYAVRNGVSSIVIGRTRDRPFARMVNRTLTQQLIQRGAHYELTIVSTPRARARARRSMRELPGLLTRSDFVLALAATVLATLAAWIVQRWWAGLDDVSLIFMVAVVVVASRTRMAAAVLAAVLSFLAYDFFFIPPVFTLYIGARMGVATALTFLAAALVAGRLASKLRMQVVALRAANAHATALETLGRRLASATTQADVAAAARDVLGSALEADVAVWLKDAPADAALPPLDDKDRAAADWALAHAQPAGRYTGTLAASAWWFLPLLSDGAALGVAGLRLADSVRRLAPEQERLALAMVADIAQALIRSRLAAELEDARVNGETERLRSALLSSVSHDLRSPLAAIIGAAGSLENYAEAMDGADRRDLLETIRLEGERLDRYIQNLLDMTRLGHGAIPLRRDWIGVDELIGSAVTRLQRYEPQARFAVRVAEGMAPIWVHPALIEQALFNVLENAVKFSPPGVPVEVDARLEGDSLVVDVRDRGPGIAEEERLRIFDMFYSVDRGDRGGKGTGLGLAICKGMIGAHGGSVVALTPADGPGTLIRIVLPLRYASAP